MVYTLQDIKHLDLMNSLAEKEPAKCEKCGENELCSSCKNATHCKGCCSAKTASYEETILKLSTTLREKGFDKHATELERKFITYKQATTLHLYKVHKEDGNDLLEFAHPEGDAHISDAENGLGDIETKPSRHKKIVEIINKTPTGKLAAKSILDSVKIALTGEACPLRSFGQSVSKSNADPLVQRYIGRILSYFKAMDDKIKLEGDLSFLYKPTYNKTTQELYGMLNTIPMTLDTAKKIQDTLSLFISMIRPKDLEALPGYRNLGIISDQCWEDINNMDIDFSPLTNGLIHSLQVASKQSNAPNKIQRLKDKLEDLKIEVAKIQNPQHLQKASQLVQQVIDAVNKLNPSDDTGVAEEKVNQLTRLIFQELGAK